MSKILRWLLLMMMQAMPFMMLAQESAIGNWINYFGNKKIKSNWNWHNEIQFRNYNALGDLEQLLIRTGIGFNLSEDNNNFLLGYGFILSKNYVDNEEDKVRIHEHRIYQQLITRQSFGRINLQHRYRFEQRFIESDFRVRFRYFLGVAIALKDKDRKVKAPYLSIYNEIFLAARQNVFDRNRLYGGIGYFFNNNVRVELGYMNQFLSNLSRDQINVNTFVNF